MNFFFFLYEKWQDASFLYINQGKTLETDCQFTWKMIEIDLGLKKRALLTQKGLCLFPISFTIPQAFLLVL